MVALSRLVATVFCLLVVAGCVTEELVVYKEKVLKERAMKPLLGVYKVQQWPGNEKPEKVRVASKDGKFNFGYAAKGKNVDVNFVLSKIPGSKRDLLLFSIPAQEGTHKANIFFICRVQKEKTLIWGVFADNPVAKGELEFQGGKCKAEDVKKFLAKKADAFVAANKPIVTLKRTKP